MNKIFRIRVGEIEHQSDADQAAGWIHKAGASEVKLVEIDDSSESAVFEVSVPEAKLERFRQIRRETEFIFESRMSA